MTDGRVGHCLPFPGHSQGVVHASDIGSRSLRWGCLGVQTSCPPGQAFLPEVTFQLSLPPGSDMAVFCLLCGKRFQTQTALQQHMEVHAGVRSYICSECNRTFPSHTALKRHLRSHTGKQGGLPGKHARTAMGREFAGLQRVGMNDLMRSTWCIGPPRLLLQIYLYGQGILGVAVHLS